MEDIIECPKCKSKKIFRYSLDSDWSRSMYYRPANDEELYTEDELESKAPDIDVYHCLECDHLFDVCSH